MGQQPLQESDLQKTLKDNVQGDILGDGFLKQVEFFYFFRIVQPADFRKKLVDLLPSIANVRAQQDERERVRREVEKIRAGGDATSQDGRDKSVATKQANIAFSFIGLQKLSNEGGRFSTDLEGNPDFGEQIFRNGMQSHAVVGPNGDMDGLQDPPIQPGGKKPNWDDAFLGRKIDGVLLIAANNNQQAELKRDEMLKVLGSTIVKVTEIQGSAREGQLRRHEHFGFLDGVSEPGIIGFDSLKKDSDGDNREDIEDKELVPPGIILCGHQSDPVSDRPKWTKEGSFLAFRWLEQKVPEFHRDLGEKFAPALGMDNTQQSRDMIGARIIGRWQSGALIIGHDTEDPMPLSRQKGMTREQIDAELKVNEHVNFQGFQNNKVCPLGAHIRKMSPREVVGNSFRIIRRGIQFGPEVTPQESSNKSTDPKLKRGLLFACYQSHLANGYSFIQRSWANREDFPAGRAGVDPMVGQQNRPGEKYQMFGMNKNDMDKPIEIPYVNPYVVPLGGEYFFSPSMDALKNVIGNKTGSSDSSGPPPPQPQPPGPVQTVSIFIENRSSGSRPAKNVTIDGRSRKLSDFWGSNISGNWMGVNGSAAPNILIQVSATSGQTFTLPLNQTPVQVSSTGPVDLSQWTITGRTT